MIDIQIKEEQLSMEECTEFVADASAGGIVVFTGTVRDQTKGSQVIRLEFESYIPMAKKEMQMIAEKMSVHWSIAHVSMHHRVGSLGIGEIPVIIAVSAAHRKTAFEACQYAIDTLKETVPIWKKEIFEGGEVWVSAHP